MTEPRRLRTPPITEAIAETMRRMIGIAAECGLDDWDGDGGSALSTVSFLCANRVLEALPPDLQSPDVSIDPDGEMVFEWSGASKRVFSISFGAGGKLSYAGLFGPSTTQGVEYIRYGLPRELVAKIQRATRAR